MQSCLVLWKVFLHKFFGKSYKPFHFITIIPFPNYSLSFQTSQKRKKFEHLENNSLVITACRYSYFCNYLTAPSRFHYQNQKIKIIVSALRALY